MSDPALLCNAAHGGLVFFIARVRVRLHPFLLHLFIFLIAIHLDRP